MIIRDPQSSIGNYSGPYIKKKLFKDLGLTDQQKGAGFNSLCLCFSGVLVMSSLLGPKIAKTILHKRLSG